MRLQVLGDVAVTDGAGAHHRLRGSQPRACLALFALAGGRSVSRHEVADVLWEGRLADHWAGAVRGVVAKVRAFLDGSGIGGACLAADGPGWTLTLPAAVVVDVADAKAALARAEAAMARHEFDVAAADATHAAALLDAELAPGATGEWFDRAREQIAHDLRRALAIAATAATASGVAGDAVSPARRLVALSPFDEHAVTLLMRAEVARGDRAAALRAYDDLATMLAAEFGIRPLPATDAVRREILGATAPSPDGARRVESSAPAAATTSAVPLIGRAREVGALDDAWQAVARERGMRVAVVEGPPGAGKTRLARDTARRLAAHGARVLWGRCGPDGGVPYEPVLDAIGGVAARDPGLAARLRAYEGALGALLPDVLGGDPIAAPADDAAGRATLFRTLAAALQTVIDRPSVWVVDDVHWADVDTVALLRYLTDALAGAPVLLVLATRPPHGAVADLLAHVSRGIVTTNLALRAFDEAEVNVFLQAAGVRNSTEIAALVHGRTGGNPFFVEQFAAAAGDDGQVDAHGLPNALRTWIERRASALDGDARRLLDLASVIGTEVDVDVLAACSALHEDALIDLCEHLSGRHFLVDGDHGRFAFAHALVRDAVYDAIAPTRRASLHRRVGAALETVPVRMGRAAAIAHHLREGGVAVAAAARAWSLAAGGDALEQAAWDAALEHLRYALDGADGDERVQALLGLGRALRCCGDRVAARAAYEEALERARDAGDGRRIAEAVLGLVGGGARGVADDLADADREARLREALAALTDTDDDLAVPVLGELALTLMLTDRSTERDALAHEQLRRARRAGPALLGRALLDQRLAQLGPEHAESRLADIDELLAIPSSLRPPELTMAAYIGCHEDHLLRGDRSAAQAALADAAAVCERYDHPYWRWVLDTWRVLDAVIDGRLDDAEAGAFAALEAQADHPEAIACLGVELVDIRLYQGRAGEVVDLLADAARANPHIPAYRAVLALCLVEAGCASEAHDILRDLTAPGAIPHDTNRLLALAVLADVAATLVDTDAAAALMPLLEPHAARHVVLNCFGGGGAYWGPVALHLARLAALDPTRVDGARRWHAEAVASAKSMGAPLALARCERTVL